MRNIYSSRLIEIPSGVTVDFKSRDVTVKGPKGTLRRSFKHLAVDMEKIEEGTKLKVDIWFGNRESTAAIR
jgi:large subunit ribosomal protein L9e